MNGCGCGSTMEREPDRYFISPPQLKKLASQEMVLVLYRHMVHTREENEILCAEWFCKNIRESKEIIEVLPVIAEMIDNCFYEPVFGSIEEWCSYHARYVFFDGSLHDGILNCIDEFVLKPDGSIDFLRTAQSVLMADKLNVVEKYRLACINCLEDHARSLWPLVRDNPQATECNSENNPLVYFWTRIMRNETSYVTINVEKMEWTAVMYFWNDLLENRRISVAGELISSGSTARIEHVLLKLSKQQLRNVLENSACAMFKSLTDATGKCLDSMLDIWNYIKYFISPDTFLKIIVELIEEEIVVGIFTNICPLLFNMWKSASNEFKQRVLNDMEALEKIFRVVSIESHRTLEVISRYSDFDMKFCVAILTELEQQSRNALWCKFWQHIIIRTVPKNLDSVMRLCFDDNDEITRFKENYMMDFDKIKGFCQIMIIKGCIRRLDDYLNLCSSNASYVACVKRQILVWLRTKPASLLYLLHEPPFVQLDAFIDSAFYDSDDAGDYKKELFEASETVRTIYEKVDKDKLGVSWR